MESARGLQVHHHHHVDSGGGPQWSVEETRELLMIRAELDPTFMETKRNKVLWEVVSAKMKERGGYHRSGEQCKCKWKNLVTRYKGFETSTMEQVDDQEGGGGTMIMRQRQQQSFPFYRELQAIFTGRMERMLWMETSTNSNKRLLPPPAYNSDDDDDDESTEAPDHVVEINKRSIIRRKINNNKAADSSSSSSSVNLKEILEELMKQQMEIERQWMKLYESKEEERRIREREWRQKMEAMENERMMFHQRWRDKEEQRSLQQETRSQKIDALITLLTNKLNS